MEKDSAENLEALMLKRTREYEELQREIESHIPPVMHGLHLRNQLMATEKPFNLPSLYVYDTNIFLEQLHPKKGEVSLCNAGLTDIGT